MSKEKSSYSDKPLLQRVVLFLAGFSNILIGYALYFMFKDDKAKDWQIEFVQRGATIWFSIYYNRINCSINWKSSWNLALPV